MAQQLRASVAYIASIRGLYLAELLDLFGGRCVLGHPALDGGLDGAECAADFACDDAERDVLEALGDDLLVALDTGEILCRVVSAAATVPVSVRHLASLARLGARESQAAPDVSSARPVVLPPGDREQQRSECDRASVHAPRPAVSLGGGGGATDGRGVRKGSATPAELAPTLGRQT